MRDITIRRQVGQDIHVDFTNDDGSTESKVISIRPYYSDVESLVPDLDENGNQIFDQDGQPLMKRVVSRVWHDPAENIEDFLRNWALAYEQGLQSQEAAEIDGAIINRRIVF